ncbi:MAG: septum site-determining protein MinC [Gammaproteobacteria bacterium]|nr:septum site-determining protein MinC [Gammaproteobacteria bacterium]
MSVNSFNKEDPGTAFELKADSFTLPFLRLLSTDADSVAKQLAEKFSQAPDFFRNTPVVIDMKVVADGENRVELAWLAGLLRSYGMIPVGIRGGNEAHNESAAALKLSVLSEGRARKTVTKKPPVDLSDATTKSTDSVLRETTVITRPVRSGQRVYAAGGDLVIVASVGSGAELIADGNIHVYGTLRGRALAGVGGNRECRIFCNNLQAELVSVAGTYRVSENLDATMGGKPVHIYLDNNSLKIDAI